MIALAKTDGYEITKEEAEAYMAELEDFELDEENIKKIAGGKYTRGSWCNEFCVDWTSS